MILVKKIEIIEFRGIRQLTLDLKSKSFAVCGPNGTGKSGVVDAIEFALTGNISRLSGKGTGNISVKQHAPHVDCRNNPEKAKVILTICIPSLNNKEVIIERSVKTSTSPQISPHSSDIVDILEELETHPEFVLSRRELISYILAEPGNRASEIQALLRLSKVSELRGTLVKISNTCIREHKASKQNKENATSNLIEALDIPELSKEKLLEAANKRRVTLGLPPIEALLHNTSLSDGLQTGGNASSTKVNKTEATADLKKCEDLLSELSNEDTKKSCELLYTEIEKIGNTPEIANGVTKENFLRIAISLIVEEKCPLCDTEWDITALKSHVETKLKKYEEATKKRNDLEIKLQPTIILLENVGNAVLSLEKHAKVLASDQVANFTTYQSTLKNKIQEIKKFLPVTQTLQAFKSATSIPDDLQASITTLKEKVNNIPEPTQQEEARDYLILCQSKLEEYRKAARNEKKSEEHSDLAKLTLDTYEKVVKEELEKIYKDVEKDFEEFYKFINQDDEENFTAKLTPSMGKLGFDVDFYGRGHFPPGAYHSEGHQDGMGLCLYLALMKKLQGGNFNFAVLDDVLMSVDTDHRREVCNLLKKYFPNTQFILTTHDEVWLKHMGTAGIINSGQSIRFRNWRPETGPTEWNNQDIWEEIETALNNDDVHAAAGKLRRYLEYIFKEICNNLQASVKFKGDGNYNLGDTLFPAVKQFRSLILKGKRASESWGKNEIAEQLEKKEKEVSDALITTNAEQWQINPAIHYNEWGNFGKRDFSPVITTFHDLVKNFICDEKDCESLFYLSGENPHKPDTLRCKCSKTNINIEGKKE